MPFAVAQKPHLNQTRQAKPVLRNFPTNNLQTPASYLIQPKTVCTCGGGCQRCLGTIQPKSAIETPDDSCNREANEPVHVVQQAVSSEIVQAQGKPKEPNQENRNLQMPAIFYYVSSTEAEVSKSGEDILCGRPLWDAASVAGVVRAANRILQGSMGITLAGEYHDLGCIPKAYIFQNPGSLKKWIKANVIRGGRHAVAANQTHIFFLDAYFEGGKRSKRLGEVVEICGNLAAIIDSYEGEQLEARTLAHEIGHLLCLRHPGDWGEEVKSYEDLYTCEKGTYLMEWGEGTCVSEFERRDAREYGIESGRLR